MPNIVEIREKLRLTQEELAEKSGLSVRTIQRIESGQKPKGYTLKALAKALNVEEAYLEGKPDVNLENQQAQKWSKIINLAALPFIFLPPLNILIPLSIMYAKKQNYTINQKLISIQLVWALIALVIFAAVLIMNDMLLIKSHLKMLLPLSWSLVNGIIIIRNAMVLNKPEQKHIYPNINIL